MFATVKSGVGQPFVNRGDPDTLDFVMGDLTLDNDYHDMDVSGVVGVGIRLVWMLVSIKAAEADKDINFRTKGATNEVNRGRVRTHVAAQWQDTDVFVVTDSSGVFSYKAVAATWQGVNICVRGWQAL